MAKRRKRARKAKKITPKVVVDRAVVKVGNITVYGNVLSNNGSIYFEGNRVMSKAKFKDLLKTLEMRLKKNDQILLSTCNEPVSSWDSKECSSVESSIETNHLGISKIIISLKE